MPAKILKHKGNSGSALASLRHCDRELREEAVHTNRHIDTEKTQENIQYATYDETVNRMRNRIECLDATTNANIRADRVEVFESTIPVPASVKDDEAYMEDVAKVYEEKFGAENVLNCYLHRDEVHEYIDHGTTRESLRHIHVFTIPEKDGQLNCRSVTSRENLIDLNRRLDEMSREKYHVPFLTGKGVNRDTVEQLKSQSEKEAVEIVRAVREMPEIKHDLSEDGEYAVVRKTDFELMREAASLGKLYADKYHELFEASQVGSQTRELVEEIGNEASVIAMRMREYEEAKAERERAEADRQKADKELAEARAVTESLKASIHERIEDLRDSVSDQDTIERLDAFEVEMDRIIEEHGARIDDASREVEIVHQK